MPGEVPLYDASGALLCWVAPGFLDQHGPQLRVTLSRRDQLSSDDTSDC